MKKIILLLFLISCEREWTKPIKYNIYPETDIRVCLIDPNQQYLLDYMSAVDTWNKSIKNWKKIYVTNVDCNLYIKEIKIDEGIYCAETYIGGNEIIVRKNAVPECFQTFRCNIMHEIGHTLGAQHVPNSLMQNPCDLRWNCPDKTTIAQIAAYNRIDINILSWCY